MHEITFSLRTITPLFLAGFDQSSAELRAPSFRGVMRYWNRALIAGLVGTEAVGLSKVVDAESKLFGSTDLGSSVTVRVSPPSQEAKEFTERISVPIGGKWQATGKGYLLWSMARSGKPEKGNVKPARWYYAPGTQFQVTLTARRGSETQFQQAIAAFWLLTQLGSLGSRARRCVGSLAVLRVSKPIDQFSFSPSANAQDLRKHLENGIQAARACASIEETPLPLLRQAEFDALAKNVCRIWILLDEQPWMSVESAMRDLGERLQNYRSGIDIERRKIFGLPLPPKFFKERRSSPLLLRITELQGNKYVAVAVLFKTKGKNVQVGDYPVIERWIDTFKGKLEVTL